ncbi:hypothetical protein VTL71DRAFT_2721 [Oculimacula yallundae]|uniref:Uncharacterized protein n=1 Tax=Oculimacula yallundae TaxID=86028 RepID=A0ABR4CBS6_9HELO
MTSEITEAL